MHHPASLWCVWSTESRPKHGLGPPTSHCTRFPERDPGLLQLWRSLKEHWKSHRRGTDQKLSCLLFGGLLHLSRNAWLCSIEEPRKLDREACWSLWYAQVSRSHLSETLPPPNTKDVDAMHVCLDDSHVFCRRRWNHDIRRSHQRQRRPPTTTQTRAMPEGKAPQRPRLVIHQPVPEKWLYYMENRPDQERLWIHSFDPEHHREASLLDTRRMDVGAAGDDPCLTERIIMLVNAEISLSTSMLQQREARYRPCCTWLCRSSTAKRSCRQWCYIIIGMRPRSS